MVEHDEVGRGSDPVDSPGRKLEVHTSSLNVLFPGA